VRNSDYLAIWDREGEITSRESDSIAVRSGLPRILSDGGLTIFSGTSGVDFKVDSHSGIVLGSMFDKSGRPPLFQHFTGIAIPRIVGTSGASLVEDWWGAFVGLVQEREPSRLHVVRDASVGMNCFYRDDGRRTLLASRADLLATAHGETFEIDWAALLGHIARPAIRGQGTALRDVREVVPGSVVTFGAGETRTRTAWTPWDFARAPNVQGSWRSMAERTRSLVDMCVGAWARKARRTIVSVSGGLDSSIVACSLAAQNHDLVCMTMTTRDPAGDERYFARALADHIDCDLVEFEEELAHVDLGRSDAFHLPRPVARGFAQSADLAHRRLAAGRGADCFMTGGGGDNVFCYVRSVAPVADAYLATGVSLTTLSALRDIARLTGVGMGSILRRVPAKLRGMGAAHAWPLRTEFLSEDGCRAIPPPTGHPWLDVPEDMPPGKAMHVAWLMAIQNHLEGFGRDQHYPNVAPLMSQPVVEHCLTVPSWMWCRGGVDRALARAAYADLLPKLVFERRTKGTPTSFVMEIVEAKAAEIEDRLLNGQLAARGFLDCSAISAFVRRLDPRRAADYLQLATLIDVEAWVNAWSAPRQPPPER
jgi:asparagine synthase (glutamine-hydrolysing)